VEIEAGNAARAWTSARGLSRARSGPRGGGRVERRLQHCGTDLMAPRPALLYRAAKCVSAKRNYVAISENARGITVLGVTHLEPGPLAGTSYCSDVRRAYHDSFLVLRTQQLLQRIDLTAAPCVHEPVFDSSRACSRAFLACVWVKRARHNVQVKTGYQLPSQGGARRRQHLQIRTDCWQAR
jgi:hypothetical protein